MQTIVNDMHYIIVILIFVCIFFIYMFINNFTNYRIDDTIDDEITLFKNLDTDILKLPSDEIVLETNPTTCHTELTPCTTDGDCFECQELLAKCQSFEEEVQIEIGSTTLVIPPNESYCLAIDAKKSRSCNVYTGKWVLVETDTGLGLICSCLYPGLVTQTDIYSDCDVSVGCNNAGVISNLYTSPLTCDCNDGYVADTANDQPICRPRQIKDVIYDTTLFPREPCPDNYISVAHDGLDESYRQQFILSNICIPDPCSIDPITTQTISGYGQIEYRYIDEDIVYFCNCSAQTGAFGINIGDSMLKTNSYNLSNACIQPLSKQYELGDDAWIKWFWGRSNPLDVCDVDFTFRLAKTYFKDAYHQILQNVVGDMGTLKFALQETYYNTSVDKINHFTRAISLMERTWQPVCYKHFIRACTEDVCVWRTPRTFLVGSKEFFTGQKCQLSRLEDPIVIPDPNDIYEDSTVYPIIAYGPPKHYDTAFPVVFYIYNDITFIGYYPGSSSSYDRTVYHINSEMITEDIDTLSSLIYTFPNYSRLS
ncbi:per-os infectivity factor [Neodiprion abietis nucleopolyhedrovirus]|uniref:Per-os infectivity factor n=1 Tax=Neodiprion abietis nucleopolyhedrovirus TaxID=204507 RepID=Q0ZP01_9CBAC|nr:per-os infectivity factor [Neodiprion abietis nucleopolyhedrovirus]ABC74953.1 per-os infectivity factor [Neodiprion abietis nucleopolyhedrovirus]